MPVAMAYFASGATPLWAPKRKKIMLPIVLFLSVLIAGLGFVVLRKRRQEALNTPKNDMALGTGAQDQAQEESSRANSRTNSR